MLTEKAKKLSDIAQKNRSMSEKNTLRGYVLLTQFSAEAHLGTGERGIQFFLNPVLSALTQVAGFTSCFSTVRKHHYATSLCQWHSPFSIQSH